ncbi:electron transfer flavoprotein subunit beta/FixA family protein [Corynebacterium halotolerans]|uniref:Electron transfer flavoprotein subunit beta n=1 Tax=Corynebacterium halotolerans YIM 70093 = DSM 44683 TaxID=1121362 RepID=M1NXN1_9CORY|nr:electron transfer flavoprotein subunit beta/FixA family protein [Corynebacterium halotolerans]AGF72260.1 electron transfer flavoprotein subunit beta [Corynebacterium halotolerans YIM 70093 = DSM 44683]
MPTIVALVKHVPDTWSAKSLEADHTLDRTNVDSVLDEINEYAVEQALRLRDDNPDADYRVVALTMGPVGADEALRKALAMGADDAVHLVDDALAGSDVLGTTWALTNALNTIEDVRLIVAGSASSDGAMGALPGILAEYRQIPALTNVRSVTLTGDQAEQISAVRETNEGVYELQAPLPAIVSVTDKADKPRFPNFKGLMAAKKHEITTLGLASVGVTPEQVGLDRAATAVTAASGRPARTGGDVIRGEDAAAQVAEFLAAEKFL